MGLGSSSVQACSLAFQCLLRIANSVKSSKEVQKEAETLQLPLLKHLLDPRVSAWLVDILHVEAKLLLRCYSTC